MALGNSLNVPAALALHKVGPRPARNPDTLGAANGKSKTLARDLSWVTGRLLWRRLCRTCRSVLRYRRFGRNPPNGLLQNLVDIITDILADDQARAASF